MIKLGQSQEKTVRCFSEITSFGYAPAKLENMTQKT